MHILYLHQYFRTPAEGGALRSYYISQALLQAGHSVTVITAQNKPLYEHKIVEGVSVHYLPVNYHNSYNISKRMLAFANYMWRSYRLAQKQKQVDLVYATSTPLTVGVTALALHLLHRKPYVFEVRDLWPEAPIQLGYIRNGVLIKLLRWFEEKIYLNAAHIIGLSPGIEAGIRTVVPDKPVSMLPNMADCNFYRPTAKPEIYAGLPIQNRFVISYTGALGRANRVSFLLDLARACAKAGLEKIVFLIAGTGAQEAQLKAEAHQQGLMQVYFLGEHNRDEIRDLLAASDATYTSFDTLPILQTNSPNKFFDSLAAGKACLVNTKGWLQELVKQHACGLYLDPLEPDTAASKLKHLISDPELLASYQRNARLLAEQKFSREKITNAVVDLVNNVAK